MVENDTSMGHDNGTGYVPGAKVGRLRTSEGYELHYVSSVRLPTPCSACHSVAIR